MAVWIDGLGLQLRVSAGYDSLVIRVRTLSEQLEPALDVLAAVALEPDFLAAEVERCKGERLDGIRRLRDEPVEVAADLLAEAEAVAEAAKRAGTSSVNVQSVGPTSEMPLSSKM